MGGLLVDPRDEDGDALEPQVPGVEGHRWVESLPGLGGQRGLAGGRVVDADSGEAGALVKAEDDRAPAGRVREGRHRGQHAVGEAASCSLDLDVGGAAAPVAVRLLEQRLAHSALLRSHVAPADRGALWLKLRKAGGSEVSANSGAAGRVSIQRWVICHGVTSDDGGPLKIHRSRIRTTHQSLREKDSWARRGRATIDPNHSPHVEGDHYLSATTPSQQRVVEAIVEDAQHDLLSRARPPVVVTEADTVAPDPRIVWTTERCLPVGGTGTPLTLYYCRVTDGVPEG